MRDLNNPSDDKLSNLWGDDFKLWWDLGDGVWGFWF
jgi:hypothetical protein